MSQHALSGSILFGPWPRITLVHGAISGWYPYPFLDVTKLGYLLTLRNTGLVFLAVLVVAVALKLLDRRLRANVVGQIERMP